MRSKARLGGIILARLDSSRLPGKQLRMVRKRPIMDWLLDRVTRIEGLDEVVLAISDRKVDDPLEQFALIRGLPCIRGSAEDVARSVHAHPTLAEVMKEAALAVDAREIHI